MRKLLYFLFLLPLSASAQKAFIRHSKVATGADTVFSVASGVVRVDTGKITINGVSYQATYTGQYNVSLNGYTYNTYTLPNGWSAIATLFCNGEIEAVTVGEGGTVKTYYTR